MKRYRRNTSIVQPRSALLAALLLPLPLAAAAPSAPAPAGSTAPMDMGAMPGMDHAGMHDMAMPAGANSTATSATKTAAIEVPVKKAKKPHASTTPPSAARHDTGGMDDGSMQGMAHDSTPETPTTSDHDMSAMDHQAKPDTSHGATHDMASSPGMAMGPRQGGRAPADARSSDYSDGVAASPAHGLHMHGSVPTGMLLVDQLEAFHGRDGNGQSWEAEGWYGSDADKWWLRSEGERGGGRLEDGEIEALWNHTASTFWSTQLGARHDFGTGPRREWAAFGVQGLAPYWFEIEATAYAGPSGRTAARLRAGYELLFTQRLILQPELEVNFHGKSDPARGIGDGLTDAKLGLRLRYEIRRELAPYIGVVWSRRFGATADFARDEHLAVFDQQWVAGVRIWF
jgi:copper resistance protein B